MKRLITFLSLLLAFPASSGFAQVPDDASEVAEVLVALARPRVPAGPLVLDAQLPGPNATERLHALARRVNARPDVDHVARACSRNCVLRGDVSSLISIWDVKSNGAEATAWMKYWFKTSSKKVPVAWSVQQYELKKIQGKWVVTKEQGRGMT